MSKSRKLIIIIILAALVLAGVLVYRNYQSGSNSNLLSKIMMANTLKLTSTAFEHNGLIPEKYTCDGQNFNPPLAILGVPANAKSLALIVDDPDASIAGGWDHWIIYNLPPTTTELKEGEPPLGLLGVGSSGNANYDGPCPPSGTHRYFFKLYALDTELALSIGASKTELETAMRGHIVDEVELIGRYARTKV